MNRVPVGRVLGAHGLRGEIKIKISSGDSSWLAAEIPLEILVGERTFQIAQVRGSEEAPIVKLLGVDDRTRAESLRGQDISVDETIFQSKPGEMIFLREFLHFEVVHPELGAVGMIKGFSSNGAQDILIVTGSDHSFEIPLVPAWVERIDWKLKKLFLNFPSDLTQSIL